MVESPNPYPEHHLTLNKHGPKSFEIIKISIKHCVKKRNCIEKKVDIYEKTQLKKGPIKGEKREASVKGNRPPSPQKRYKTSDLKSINNKVLQLAANGD